MVPNGWKKLQVSDICNLQNGHSFKPSQWDTKGLPIIRIQNLNGSDNFNYYSGEVKDKWLVETGQLLFSWAGTRGVSFGPFVWRKERGVLNQHIYKVYANEMVCSEWLYTALKWVTNKIEAQAHGFKATLLHVQKKDIDNQAIMVPPLSEQRRMANLLSTWDQAISVTERLIDTSKQQKKALMQKLLTGKKRLLDDSGKSFDSEWRFSTFPELFKVANNKKTQVKSSDYLSEGKTPIVDQGKQLVSGYTNNDEKYIELPVIIFGDHTRVVKWVNFEFAQGADGTQVLKSTKLLNDKYAYYLLSDTDIPNLGYSRHMRELKEKDFKYPTDIREQEKIASVLTNADKEIDLLEQQLADLKQEKKALMQQLLTGKRRVKIDEKEVA